MSHDYMLKRAGRIALTAVLTASVSMPYPTAVFADTIEDMDARIEELRNEEAAARAQQEAAEAEAAAAEGAQVALEAEVAEAQARLDVLYQEAEACENDLITITNQLNETEARIAQLTEQIAQTTAELEQAQVDLASIIHDNYTYGSPTLLSVVLSATDFDDLIARITYANKVAQHETDTVGRVKDLKATLEQQKAEQEQVREL